jgi:hypothetical protein
MINNAIFAAFTLSHLMLPTHFMSAGLADRANRPVKRRS